MPSSHGLVRYLARVVRYTGLKRVHNLFSWLLFRALSKCDLPSFRERVPHLVLRGRVVHSIIMWINAGYVIQLYNNSSLENLLLHRKYSPSSDITYYLFKASLYSRFL